MTSTRPSPIGATATVLLIMTGAPLWLLTRITQPLLPLRSTDIILAVCLALWVITAHAIIGRDAAVDSTILNRTSPKWHAFRLVDASVFGSGFSGDDTAASMAPQLYALRAPETLSADQLPSLLLVEPSGYGTSSQEDLVAASVPVLNEQLAASLSAYETETYVVARRDTFWSISETVLGDGREWQQLQALNLGREVAPGVALEENHELRIGWSILLPVIPTADDAAVHEPVA